MSKKKQCACGEGKFGRCERCSKVKMWVGLKTKYKDFKVDGFGPVRYSYLKYNKHSFAHIVEEMKLRLVPKFEGKYNAIMFFDQVEGNAPIKITP